MNSERRYKVMEEKKSKKKTWRKNLAVLLVFSLVMVLSNAYGTEGMFQGLIGVFEAKAADNDTWWTNYYLKNEAVTSSKEIKFVGESGSQQKYIFYKATDTNSGIVNVNTLDLKGSASRQNIRLAVGGTDSAGNITYGDSYSDATINATLGDDHQSLVIKAKKTGITSLSVKIYKDPSGNGTTNPNLSSTDGMATTMLVVVPIIIDDTVKYTDTSNDKQKKNNVNPGYDKDLYYSKIDESAGTQTTVPTLVVNYPGTTVMTNKYPLKLIGDSYNDSSNPLKFSGDNLSFSLTDSVSSDDVITVDQDGKISSNGAGVSSVTITKGGTDESDVPPASLNVIVPFKLTKESDYNNTTDSGFTKSVGYEDYSSPSINGKKSNEFVYWASGTNSSHVNEDVNDKGIFALYSNLYVNSSAKTMDEPVFTYYRYNPSETDGHQGITDDSKFTEITNTDFGISDPTASIDDNGYLKEEFDISKATVGFYKIVAKIPESNYNPADTNKLGTYSDPSDTVKKYIYQIFYVQVNADEETEIIGMVKNGSYNPMADSSLHVPSKYNVDIKVTKNDKDVLTTANKKAELVNSSKPKNSQKVKVLENGKYIVTITQKTGLGFTYSLKATLYVGDSTRISPIKKTIYIGDTDTLQLNTSAIASTDYDPDDITWEYEDDAKSYVSLGIDENNKSTENDKSTVTIQGKQVKKDSDGNPTYVTVIATITINKAEIPVEYRVTVREPKETPLINIIPSGNQTIRVGQTVTMAAVLVSQSAVNIDDKSIEWESSDTSIATVEPSTTDDGGIVNVTGVAPGTVTIIAKNSNNKAAIGYKTITVKMPVSSVKITDTAPIVKPQGSSYQLHWKVLPNTADQDVTFKSSNTAIATVDNKGLVTFVKGTVTPASITVTSVDDPTKSDSIEVVCTTPTAGITLDKSELTLNVGETYNFKVTITPTDASDKGFKISSSDEEVGTVSSDGTFTALQAGKTVVKVETTDGKYKATCDVTVKQNSTGIEFDASELNLNVGDTYTLKVTFTPATTTEKNLIWSSDDETIATVEDGTVTAVSVGECEVSASTTNGNVARCKVTVYQALGGLTLNETEITIDKGDTFQLEAIFDPDDTTNQDVTWESSKASVAKVDDDGLVTGVTGGLAIITATSDDGNYTAQCVVTVMEYASSLSVKPKSKTIEVGDTVSLIVTASPASVTNKGVKYKSSKKSVASVNKNGVVTGKKVGTATITITAKDGSGAKTKCTIRVVRRASSLSLNKYLITMIVGKTTRLRGTVKPSNTTVKGLKYKSADENVAYVTNGGKITALAVGETNITVKTKDGSGLSKKCKVIVRDYVAATKITLSATDMTMPVGDRQTVTYSLSPNNTDDKVTWSSNNSRVASIGRKSGVISANAPGTATITGSTTSGLTATMTLTVVGLSFYTLNMEQYDTYHLSVLGGTTGTVSWDTSNASVATVDTSGNVSAKKAGTCYIYARVNGALLRCRVTVRNIQ